MPLNLLENVMTFDEFKQRHEENLDYLIEQLEDDPMDVGAYHFFTTKSNEINREFTESVVQSLTNGEML